MLNVDYTTIRDVQRNYKKISEQVNDADLSYVVMSNNRPQFVIVGIEFFTHKLQKPQEKNSAASLLSLVEWAEAKKIESSEDLSENHDKYLAENYNRE